VSSGRIRNRSIKLFFTPTRLVLGLPITFLIRPSEQGPNSVTCLLTLFVDFTSKVLCYRFLHFLVVHEFSEEFLILIHPVDEHLSQYVIELQCEVLSAIDLSRLAKVVVFKSIFFDLVEEELIRLCKVRTQFLVNPLNNR